MIGEVVGQFRIIEEIGAGAMGVVYRARDERLHRDVALKFLPAGTLGDEDSRRRFQREALALSRMNHPGIATVYDFQTAAGRDFLVMEYIAGESLEQRFARGALPEAEILDLGVQLGEALVEAHRQGVIHRDLKPANLRVTPEGRLKILDFGLARWLAPASASVPDLTMRESQGLSGTLAYMAPELFTGAPPSEASDVYAAGLVLYEAATGSLPFPGLHMGALLDAIRHLQPPAPRSRNPKVSAGLETVILRCLEIQPERRYASSADLLADLRRLSSGAGVSAPPRRERRRTAAIAAVAVALIVAVIAIIAFEPRRAEMRSLAVLPLGNLSGDPGQEYFADGMTEQLIAQLSHIRSVRVISLTSVMRYKHEHPSMPMIARELNVDGVLEGNVLKDHDRLRTTVHLIAARDDQQLWSGQYDGDTTDVLGLQSRMAEEIVREIQPHITPAERAGLSPAGLNPVAYQLYLRGRYEWNRRREGSIRAAIRYFQQAIEADSTYALAHSGLADAWAAAGLYGLIPPNEAHDRALASARRAVALAPNLSEAHTSLGHVLHNFEWKWDEADQEYLRAIALNPNNSIPHLWRAHLLAQRGSLDEAEEELAQAQQLDPMSLTTALADGVFAYYSRHYEIALERLHRAATLDSTNSLVHRTSAGALDQLGREREAMTELSRSLELGGEPLAAVTLRSIYSTSGLKGTLEFLAAELIRRRETGTYQPAEHIAELFARLGRAREALSWLEVAYRERDTELNRLRVDPIFDSLRSLPQFTDLMRRVGLAPTPTS